MPVMPHNELTEAMLHVLRMAENGAAFEPRHNRTITALVKRKLLVGGPSTGYSAPPVGRITEEGRAVLRLKARIDAR